MAQERASKKQQELLSFVDGFIRENGYAPSYREIMNALGYKSVSTVAIHIDNLIAKGYLERRGEGAQRSLEVVSLRPKSEADAMVQNADWKVDLFAHIESKKLDESQQATVNAALELLEITQDSKDDK